MSDSVGALIGAAFIAGLFVVYVVQRRAARRPPPPASEPTMAETGGIVDQEAHYEFNFGIPFVYVMLLVGFMTHRGEFWGYIWESIYLLLVAAAAYFTFSPAQLAAEQERVPHTTRTQYFLMTGAPYFIFPAIGWILVGPFEWNPGALVPAVPWLLMYGFGMLVGTRTT